MSQINGSDTWGNLDVIKSNVTIGGEPSHRGNASKPLSLHPLGFDDAVRALLSVDPDDLQASAESPSPPDHSQSANGS